jgi:hypothetical protein
MKERRNIHFPEQGSGNQSRITHLIVQMLVMSPDTDWACHTMRL